jgi:hypothetical protein
VASIYFPLRTNVEYWDLDRLELDLESRLKLSAILYDELILEDGGYVALVGPKMSLSVPVRDLDAVPEGFFEAHIPPEGGEFYFAFGDGEQQVEMTSRAQRRYQICFGKSLAGTGLLDMPWVHFSDLGLTKPAINQIEQLAKQDMDALHNGDLDTYQLNAHAAKSVNHDWIMASICGWDLNMDPSHESLLRKKLSLLAENTDALNPPIDFEIVFPRLPVLTRVSWDEIFKTRNHPAVVEFRSHLATLAQDAHQAYLQSESAHIEAVRHQVTKWRDDQLIQELSACLPTRVQTAGEIVVNILFLIGGFTPLAPFVALLDGSRGIVAPLVEHIRARHSTAAAFVKRHQDHNR